jgi:hypothetical protein
MTSLQCHGASGRVDPLRSSPSGLMLPRKGQYQGGFHISSKSLLGPDVVQRNYKKQSSMSFKGPNSKHWMAFLEEQTVL